jgi:Zn-finger nucleic acid-binding protein
MDCPVCGKSMVEQNFGGVQVDVCSKGCKGIWFDWLELVRLDENDEGAGQALEEALKSPRVNDANREKLNCPKCGSAMHAHKYASAKEVSVDECYGCGGFFLDSGELKEVRDNYMSEEEQDAYVDKLLADVPEYKEMAEEIRQEKAELRASAGRKFGGFLRGNIFPQVF